MSELVVLRLDLAGMVRDVIVDTTRIAFHPGQAWTERVSWSSTEKASAFVREITNAGVATDWELELDARGAPRVYCASGYRCAAALVIVAAPPNAHLAQRAESALDRLGAVPDEVREAVAELARVERGNRPRRDPVEEMTALHNELAAVQRELAQKNARLERLVQEKDRAIGTVAHDLRNPLASVLLQVELLLDGVPGSVSEPQAKFLRAIERASRHMLVLVDSLLDLSTLETGKVQLELDEYDLIEQLREQLELAEVVANQKSITLELRGESPLVVRADRAKLRQIIQNLFSNAIKYSHPGGRVVITAARDAGEVRLSVQDCGVGIPKGELDRIFEPFGAKRGGGTAGEKSTGLGLAIARRIAIAHGGRIDVESEPGRGSTFTLVIPAS